MSRFPEKCPHCNANLDLGDIYEYFRLKGEPEKEALESAEMFGWTKAEPQRFTRLLSIYDWSEDRTTGFECPDCGKEVKASFNPKAGVFRTTSGVKMKYE